MFELITPSLVRVSIGSALLLGLLSGRTDVETSTIYLLQYHQTRCSGDCGFCSQARTSKARNDLLSRVTWPVFQLEDVIKMLRTLNNKPKVERICIQVMNYPTAFNETLGLVERFHSETDIPISVSCQPLSPNQIKALVEKGLDRINMPLDTATKELFEKIKGKPHVWERQIRALNDAVKILGSGRVGTHFIVGLGERDYDVLNMVQTLFAIGIYSSLFAFTPIAGTRMANQLQPSINRYRKIQLAYYLITTMKRSIDTMHFDENGSIIDFGINDTVLKNVINLGQPFMTSGCPGCNRPYFNERPTGPLFNYPRKPTEKELYDIEKQIIRGVHRDG